MAKSPAGPGVYAPHSWRARKLISQLRRATHRTVQNAIIQELIHELSKGSRRARKMPPWLRAQARKQAGRVGGAVRRRAADVAHRVRYGPRMQCSGCGKEFHNKLLFAAHARSHRRETTQPAARPKANAPARQQARAHARDVIGAAGTQGRAVQAAARSTAATGRPLGSKDLKALTKNVASARDTVPSRAASPAVPAREAAAPKAARPVRPVTASPPVRARRGPAAAPAVPVAEVPARPGRGA